MATDTDKREWIDTKAREIYEDAKVEIYYMEAMKQAAAEWRETFEERELF